MIALCSSSSFAVKQKGEKREREDFSPQIEKLDEQLKGKDQADQESILLDVSADDVRNFVHAMEADRDLLDKHLEVYNTLRKRV